MIAALALAALAPTAIPADVLWETSFEAAFERAQKENKVVFVIVNMDDEPGNERMLDVYGEASIAELTGHTVNLAASLFDHGSKDNPCKRFGHVSCTEHRRIEAEVRKKFVEKDAKGHVIAPQHVFVGPKGDVLLSVSWEISRSELEWCLVTAIKKLDPEATIALPEGARAPRQLVMDGVVEDAEVALQPLSKKEIKEAIKEMRSGFGAFEGMDSFQRLLVTDDKEAIKYVKHELDQGMLSLSESLQASQLRTIGAVSPQSFWEAVEPQLESKDPSVRSEAAVAMEQLGAPKSVKVLKGALGKEKSEFVKKNILRALGTAGADDKGARRLLLKYAEDDEALLRRNALFALGSHVGDEDVDAALLAALGGTDADDRSAAALALAFGRRMEHRDAVARAAEAQSGSAGADLLGRALAVLDGANFKVIAADVGAVTGDEIPRTRFFGRKMAR